MKRSSWWRTVFDLPKLKAELEGLKGEAALSGFWNNAQHAAKVSKHMAELEEEIGLWEGFEKETAELLELAAQAEGDKELQRQITERANVLQDQYEHEEFRIFLSGSYDRGDCYLSIYSGAGGRDAQDWAEMLLRMYQRYAEHKGYKATLRDETQGEEGGIKEATLEVRAPYAYGFLKGEGGVHRLVRISPFSAQKLRHTSFALVDVMPKIEEAKELEIPDDDLRIDTFRASGPGGQSVNRRESAVRITHMPSGISAGSQSERSQAVNREKAFELLRSKLYVLKRKERDKTLAELKGGPVSVEWGSQIRSYVLHPYQLVKDHRTGIETPDTQAVLDGDLDAFIDAEVRMSQ